MKCTFGICLRAGPDWLFFASELLWPSKSDRGQASLSAADLGFHARRRVST